MDNSPEDITLTDSQFHDYQTGCLHINAPDGHYLESIGHNIQEDDLRISASQLREQLALINTLLCYIQTEIELPQDAVLGLADLIHRAAHAKT